MITKARMKAMGLDFTLYILAHGRIIRVILQPALFPLTAISKKESDNTQVNSRVNCRNRSITGQVTC